MMFLTEGKHRGTGEAAWDQITVWLQRKKPKAESRKIHQATWLRQRKAVERDERMETNSSRSSFLIVFLLLLTSPSPFPPSSQGKVRLSGICSPISFPTPLNTIWESTLLMEFPDVHAILLFVSFWICSFSSDVLCLSSGIGHASKLHTLQQKAPESQLEESLMQARMTEPSLLVFTPAELFCRQSRMC